MTRRLALGALILFIILGGIWWLADKPEPTSLLVQVQRVETTVAFTQRWVRDSHIVARLYQEARNLPKVQFQPGVYNGGAGGNEYALEFWNGSRKVETMYLVGMSLSVGLTWYGMIDQRMVSERFLNGLAQSVGVRDLGVGS